MEVNDDDMYFKRHLQLTLRETFIVTMIRIVIGVVDVMDVLD